MLPIAKELKLYSTLSRKLENFEPLEAGKVKMYCCGPTVYNFLHIGNFRGPVFYNFMRNWLEYLGYEVNFVLNYTDIDDKIINRANEEGVGSTEISEKYIAEFEKDYKTLKLKPHSKNPRVSEYLNAIQNMVADLIKNNKAYVVDGEVLYSIKSFPEYGKLSNRNPDDLQAGVRIEVDNKKQNPLDFSLWKPAKPNEPSWPSPWGNGRPGWHIECSAMAKAILGEQIDIHGGGADLIFPHHENEIAQSEGCSGKSFARYWVHNNMLNLSGMKMSKSIGNIIRGRDFFEQYNPELYKYMMMSVHYRSVTDFGEQAIELATSGLARIYSAMAMAESYLNSTTDEVKLDDIFKKITDEAWIQCEKAFNSDFGTPDAFAKLFDVVRQFNSQVKRGIKANPAVLGKCKAFLDFTQKFGSLMSLFQEPAGEFLVTLDNMLLKKLNLKREDVDLIVKERAQARLDKDFAKSDELRKKLTDMGISVSDTSEGSVWEVTK